MTELAYKYDTQCDLCGSTDTHELFGNVRDPLLNVPGEFSIYSCRNCAVCFTCPKLEEGDLSSLYGDRYFSPNNKLNPLERIYRFDQYRYDLDFYSEYLRNQSAILDYGCGDGSRIEHLHRKGYTKVRGVDLYNSYSANLDKSQYFIHQDPDNYIPDAKFDVVLMYHVLEHLFSPLQTLQHIHDHYLDVGGFLVIQVPNAGCAEFFKYRERWFNLDVPRHLWHYNVQSLEYLVTRAGFRVLRVACKNSVLHPTATLPTVYDFDIRLEWTKDGYSPLKAYPRFLLFSLLSIPNSIRRNLRNDNALMNLIAVKP
jgi:SAM-dependent methyltransferase